MRRATMSFELHSDTDIDESTLDYLMKQLIDTATMCDIGVAGGYDLEPLLEVMRERRRAN